MAENEMNPFIELEGNVEAEPTIELVGEVNMGSVSSEKNAEAWAVGERGGVPVGPTDQTYHNNSKYYSEHAGENAEAWATGERGGVPVDSSDPAYHNNAKYYSQQAHAESATVEETRAMIADYYGGE